MIDEDQPQRQAAKQIEPQFALADRRQRDRRRQPGRAMRRRASHPLSPASGGPAIRSATDVIWHRLEQVGFALARRERIGQIVPASASQASYEGLRRVAAAL